MNNHNHNLFLAALAAVPGPMIDMLPRGQRRIGPKCGARKARGPLPSSKLDRFKQMVPYMGKAYRHRFTGQVRRLGEKQCPDGYVAMYNSTMGCWRPARKALDWLRNSEEV